MQTVLRRYAELLTGYCLALKEGDRVFVRSTTLAEPLLLEVYRSIMSRGAFYDSKISIDEEDRAYYEASSNSQFSDISPIERLVYEKYNAILTIRAPHNLRSIQSIDPEKKKAAQQGKKELHDLFSKRSATGDLRWTLCEYPTDSSAQECGMSRSEYADFVFSACRLFTDDPVKAWLECSAYQKRIADYLDKVSLVRFVADKTDISFSVKGRRWINSDGKRNMPSGEVFSAPVEDSVNGTIRFSYPAIFMGDEIEGLSLEVSNGLITKWSAEKGQALLDRIFEIEGSRRFGEVAVGLNAGVKRFTKNILFDEKMDGTVHMAIGSTYAETGGKNESAIHLDFINDMKNGKIFADGKEIYSNGTFTF